MSQAASAKAEAAQSTESASIPSPPPSSRHGVVSQVDQPGRAVWTSGRLIAGAGMAILGVLVTLDAWRDIADIALHDEESSHIFLVPVIVAWLVWNRWDAVRSVRPQVSLAGPILIALGGVLNAYGFHNLNQAAWHGGAVLTVIGCFVTVVGWRVLWTLLPAFVVLAFLVPVPGMIRQQISIPLQVASANATAAVFHAFAIPISHHGSVLRFHGQDIAVAEACNGMRMVFALLLVTYATAFAMPLRNWVRALLLVLSPLFAIVCNVIRMVPTVWLFGYYPKTIGPLFHDFSGWGMVLVSFLMILGMIYVLQWAQIPIMQPEERLAAKRSGA